VVRNYRTTTSTKIWERAYSIPALDSGYSFEVQPFLEINEGANEFHLIEFAIDPNNLVVESDEANNLNHTISYFLEPNPGVCP
jgi:subtilase family serine protease